MIAETDTAPALCPRCQGIMASTTVKTAIWQGPRLAIVEDIPAHVCEACLEQFYDDEVSEALRRLSEEGFPAEKASKQIVVPVFSLEGRVVRRRAFPDDTYVD